MSFILKLLTLLRDFSLIIGIFICLVAVAGLIVGKIMTFYNQIKNHSEGRALGGNSKIHIFMLRLFFTGATFMFIGYF